MQQNTFLPIFRFITAGVVITAVIAQLAYGINHDPNYSVANFFSFFTIESNILGALAFIVAGWAALKGKSSLKLDLLRGAATLYMAITGVVYVLLLSNIDVQTPLPWVNLVLHYLFPIVMVVDWLIDSPKKGITFKSGLIWLVFPVLYGVYSLVRGAQTGWYPYPFLNADKLGYGEVAVNMAFVAAASVVMAGAVVGLARLADKR